MKKVIFLCVLALLFASVLANESVRIYISVFALATLIQRRHIVL